MALSSELLLKYKLTDKLMVTDACLPAIFLIIMILPGHVNNIDLGKYNTAIAKPKLAVLPDI